jgi:hypothetical protein
MDLNSLQNLHDLRVSWTLKPRPTLSLAFEAHLHRLDRGTDFWYNVGGVARNFAGAAAGSGAGYRINSAYGRDLGRELDVVAGWSPTPSTQIELGASRYFRGDYIKRSLAAVGSRDASYLYLQASFNL